MRSSLSPFLDSPCARESRQNFVFIKTFAFLFCAGFLFFGLAGQVEAAACGAGPFYISSSIGADTNNGTSAATPWAHHPWDANKSGLASCTLAGDNIVYMRRGDVWYDASLAGAQTGSNGHQITTTSVNTFYKTSSTDAYPKLSGAYDPATLVWGIDGGTIYKTTTVTAIPNIVVYNDSVLSVSTQDCNAIELNKYKWAVSTTGACVANTLYVNVGEIPSIGILEAGKRNYVYINTQGYHTFSFLEGRVANTTVGGVFFNNGYANVIFDNVIVKRFALYGIYQYNNTGCQVTNSTVSGGGTFTFGYGIYVNACTGVIVTGNSVTLTPTTGVQVIASSNHTISGNEVYNNRGSGIVISTSHNGSIHDNLIHNNCTDGLWCTALNILSSNSNLIYLNTVYDNSYGYYNIGAGFGINVGGSSVLNLVYRNNVYNNYVGIALSCTTGTGGNIVSYNLVKNSTVDGIDTTSTGTGYEYIYSNTVIHSPSASNSAPYTGHGLVCQQNCIKTVMANNNIIVDVAAETTAAEGIAIAINYNGVRLDYNNIFIKNGVGYGQVGQLAGVKYASLALWQAAVQADAKVQDLAGNTGATVESHSLSSNPLFVSSSNFHLLPTSPAINAGTDVGLATDFEGNPKSGPNFDIGAYEFQDSTTPTTAANIVSGTYNSIQIVTLTCDDGVGVGCDKTYYTLTGIDPTTGSTVYSGAISIPDNATTVLKFFSRDKNENSETPIKSKTYTIDTTFPQTSIDSNPDALINTNSATFTFSASETATFQCKLDSGAYVSCSTPKNYSSLSEGAHTFYVKATDTATNEDATPASYAFTVDSLAPTISNLEPNDQTFYVTTTSANLTLTTSEKSTCKYSTTSGTVYGSMTVFDTTNDDTHNHSTFINGLNIGTTYDYYILCQDTAANESTEEHLTFSIAPTENNNISLESIKIKVGRTWNKFKDTIRIAKNKLKLKQEDTDLANGTIKIYKDNKRIDTIDINSDGSWDKILKLKDEFSGWIKIRQYDQFGTLLSTNKAKIKVDTEDPKFDEAIPEKMTIGRNQKISFPATDDNSGIDFYKVKLSDIRDWRQQNEDFYQIPEDVPNGNYDLLIRAYDKAGNWAEEKTTLNIVQRGNSVNLTNISLNPQPEIKNPDTQSNNPNNIKSESKNNPGSGNTPAVQDLKLQSPPAGGFKWYNPFTWF